VDGVGAEVREEPGEELSEILKLFEQGRLSSGKAAELCGMTRVDFLLLAGKAGIPVLDLDGEELDREFLEA